MCSVFFQLPRTMNSDADCLEVASDSVSQDIPARPTHISQANHSDILQPASRGSYPVPLHN